MKFGDNLKYLREQRKLSQQNAADALGLPRTTLGDYERNHTEPDINLLKKMADFFKISLDDLLRHSLDQLMPNQATERDFKVLAITVDGRNKQNIELVDVKAEAGYMQSFQDPQYIRELPRMYIPRLPQGSYRAFEIQGESMLPMEPGTIIIGQYIEKIAEIKNDQTYILIHKTDGIVYKRLRLRKDKKEIYLSSDNPLFESYTLPYNQIAEIWVYRAHLAFSDMKWSIDKFMDNRITEMQIKVKEIHKRVMG